MEKYFCDYNQSLVLKELGFKERTLFYFEGDVSKMHFAETGWDFNNSFKNCISRPLKSQVFDWFREEHKLQSTVTSISQESWQWHIQKPGQQLGKLYNEDFYTYEEAESACIDKLIEIVKDERKTD